MTDDRSFVVLSGGVGGAKLVLGLSRILPAERLTVIANTGDDFEHLGLPISPDIDTLIYTLADAVNTETGWGRSDETWNFMAALEQLGGETWFRLGDRDLATHVRRASLIAGGATLAEATADLCRGFGVKQSILPMADQPVRTRIVTDDTTLDFQHYFVRERAEPSVRRIDYHGATSARPPAAALAALRAETLAGIIVAPSNPYLSIDPILSVPAMRAAIVAADVPVVSVSPVVDGVAVKGPTAKIMRELGHDVSAAGVAAHYGDLLDGFIVDLTDNDAIDEIAATGLDVVAQQTLMSNIEDKIALAKSTVEYIARLTAAASC
ncbi:MAG: 2-phospho-L-lactate transferase [Gammaproteobacteria bacterium]